MVNHLVELIEAKLGWGKGENWSNRDFEELSEQIFNDTKKRLSVTTLKRIWGRAERIANPSSGTLDILSEYLGHANWREFVNTYDAPLSVETMTKSARGKGVPVAVGVILLVGALLAFYLPTRRNTVKRAEALKAGAFSFKSKTIGQGIPNSVVFEYDASGSDNSAKIQIQQDWDENKRINVAKEDSVATCIYYRPGFFKSKLVVDGTIVAEEDVFIPTRDWLGTIELDTLPIYLDLDEIKAHNQIAISEETVSQYKIDPRTSEVIVSMYLVKDFGALFTDEFEMSMLLKNTFEKGLTGCQWARIFILYEGGAVGIPLAKKGCSSNFNLMAFGEFIDGKKTDLSGFGVDFSDLIALRCISKDGTLQILVNEQLAYKMEISGFAEKIKGISIHFEGAGTVKNVELGNTSSAVYSF